MKKKSFLSIKLVRGLAGIVEFEAMVVLRTNTISLEGLINTFKAINTVQSVLYSTDILGVNKDLDISKRAKKLQVKI